jgi:hypothetical protein
MNVNTYEKELQLNMETVAVSVSAHTERRDGHR